MTTLKFHFFIWIQFCFFSAIIFRCECDDITVGPGISQSSSEISTSTSQPDVTESSIIPNTTNLTTPSSMNLTTQNTTNLTASSASNLTSMNSSDDPHPRKIQDDCSNREYTFLCLLCGFLFVSVVGLAFVAYFLHLKRIEVQSKLCPCRIQRMDSSSMDQPQVTPEAKYVLDPTTVSKLLAHCNISISANSLNTTTADTAKNSNQQNLFADQSFKKRFSFRRGKKSSADKDNQIATMNVYKYLEYLKKQNENVYAEPHFPEPQYDNLTGLYEASTSRRRSSNPSQQLPSFLMNEIKNNKLPMNSTVRF